MTRMWGSMSMNLDRNCSPDPRSDQNLTHFQKMIILRISEKVFDPWSEAPSDHCFFKVLAKPQKKTQNFTKSKTSKKLQKKT